VCYTEWGSVMKVDSITSQLNLLLPDNQGWSLTGNKMNPRVDMMIRIGWIKHYLLGGDVGGLK
jgi:hypothetical protein